MSLESFVNQFGYIALILGLVIEGETILVIAAFLAHRGHIELPWVIVISILVELLSNQYFFWLGNTKGEKFLEGQPKWNENAEKAKDLLNRNADLLFLTFQFIYGFRIVVPFVCGMNKLNHQRFSLLNLIGVTLWALFYGIGGYLFGHVIEILLADMEKYELWIILCIVALGGMIWLYRNRNQLLKIKVGNNE